MSYTPSKGETVTAVFRGGKPFEVIVQRVNPKTVTVMRADGRRFLVHPMWIVDPLEDEATEIARLSAQMPTSKNKAGAPAFTVGDMVEINAPHAPKFHGTHVVITAVNRTRYRVKAVVGGNGTSMNVPFNLVKAV
jgi:hypothetical protein